MTKEAENAFLTKVFELDEVDDLLEQLEVPDRLKQRLYGIGTKRGKKPRWYLPVAAAASIALCSMLVLTHHSRTEQAELEQARQELAIAFYYIDNANQRIEPHLKQVLSQNLKNTTVRPVLKSTQAIRL